MIFASTRTGKKEQRRHARLATLQSAQIRFGEGEAIPAEIRDYCQTGLYVAFPGAHTPDAALPALVGDSVQVVFEVGASGAFRCKGRVAHVSPGGVGVFTATLPEEIVQALRAASGHLAQPDSGRGGDDLSPQQTQALQLECTNQFRSFLDRVMEDFFQRAVERLREAGQDEPSFLERSRYDYGVQELTQRRSRIEGDFFNAVRDRISYVGSATDASLGPPGAKKLSLVDEAEFEDWLSLSAVIKQIETAIATPLGEFEQRYSRLIGMPVDRKNNSLGPEMIGRAFQDAIQVLDFSNPMRAVLYKTLGQAVSNHSLALYKQLNQTLASLQPDTPPEPDRGKAKSKPAPAAEVQPVESDKPRPDLAEIADTLNALYKQDQAGTPQTPESAEYSLDRILATLNQSQRRAASATPAVPAARSSRQMGAAPGHPAAARPEILQVVSRMQQTARQMVGRDESALRPPGSSSAGATLPEASLRELQLALDSLPRVSQATAGMPASLADQIDAHIASSGGGARWIAPDHRRILDTTSDLFARARADFVPSSDVELLVKRLERPLLKLALQDANFPNLPDHPARQVLNLIEQYAVAADDKGKFFDAKLQRFLYLLVDRVCARADEDPGIFEVVRDSLEKVLLPILQVRRTRVARLQEASEGRERIRTARTRVNAELEQRLAGREVPAMLLRLLDAGWRQYLVLLEMRQGAQGELWDAGLAVLDRLFAWLGPDHADVYRSPEAAQALLSEVERTLVTVNVDAKLLAAFMDELGDRLADASSCPAAAATAMVLVPPGRLATSHGEGGDAPAHRRLAERLRVGDWWDFSLDDSKVPMQLIWVSQPPLGCAFANRSATSKTEFTLAELSRRMQDGLVNPGKDLDMPLFERSEHALFDETYQRMVHQVMHDPLTGLLNRKGFMHHLTHLAMPDQEDKAHAIGIIEFDQFRMIYNTCGVAAAESLARNLANEVRAQIGPDAAIATFRDDTLAILLPNCSRDDGCQAVDSLLKQVKDYHFQHGEHSYSIGFNIGLTEYAPTRFSAAEAIRHADSACITAKSMGRNRMQIYEQSSPQLQSQESMMDWAGRLDSFLKGSGLYLRCQQVMPIRADNTSLLPYYEILLGIDSEAGQEVSPVHFVPAVESLQRSHELDIWVMRNVFEWIRANPEGFASLGGFAINLSANSLSNPEVMSYLQQVLPGSDIPTHKIAFEITETAAIESYGAAQDFIREIRRFGCKFSLDDFGSGFTSYAHLKNLRTDTLKIDGGFVKDMLQNSDDYAMVKSMNDIGHSLGLITVAEYVESPLILEALREIGVDYAQGYAIHKPCRIDELLSAREPVFIK